MTVLFKFAYVGSEFADLLDAARAAAVAVAAIERHSADLHVQRIACAALGVLCFHADFASRRAANAAVAACAPRSLLAALHRHADDEVFCKQVPLALAGLLTANSWPSDGAAWRDTRAALVSHIAAHGCPVSYGPAEAEEPDLKILNVVVAALVKMPDCINAGTVSAIPPGAAVVLCKALRAAAGCHAEQDEMKCTFSQTTATACIHLAVDRGTAGAAFSAERHALLERWSS